MPSVRAGEYAEAIELMHEAVKLDPKNPSRQLNLGVAYRYARDYRPAAASIRRSLELDPASVATHINLAAAEAALGNSAEAIRQLSLAEALSVRIRPNVFRLAQMALTYSLADSSDDAERLFNELMDRAQEEPIGEAIWTRAYMAVGDYEQALLHLESSVRDRVPTDVSTLADLAANAGNDPSLDADPRFQQLLSGLWDD